MYRTWTVFILFRFPDELDEVSHYLDRFEEDALKEMLEVFMFLKTLGNWMFHADVGSFSTRTLDTIASGIVCLTCVKFMSRGSMQVAFSSSFPLILFPKWKRIPCN